MTEKKSKPAPKAKAANVEGSSEVYKEFWERAQVEELLEQQKADCADAIQANNLSEYTAKRKILETKKVEF